ncbi:DUF739 family protein [Thermodesulfobacteriota bacterium]
MNQKLKGKIIEVYGTQADFAQAINKDESFVSRIIRKRRNLTEEEQQHWADLLGCMADTIFTQDTKV